MDKREAILAAARATAQAHGYAGLNFRDLAATVGIKSASIHYYFPSKADLGAAVAKRYWEDSKVRLERLWAESQDPAACLVQYPILFRKALENENRMCLSGFMAAEYDDLPRQVQAEVRTFGDIQVAWLAKVLSAANHNSDAVAIEQWARAIFAAIGGAQVVARSRADITMFDDIIKGYRVSGLLPAAG